MFKEQKYTTIKKINNGQISKGRAEVELALSRRQINRLIQVYQTKGKRGFIHGNRDRKPASGLSDETKKHILDLYNKKYEAFNIAHFTEKLNEVEHIHVSYTTVRNLLYQKNLLSPRAFRQTRRKKERNAKSYKKRNNGNKFSQKKKTKY
uniref:hypothetical protein n=1 Tax=Carnobacterium alterfunditum TaxID=28230 RepID=UPI003593C9B0